jgi:surfactin synthase thioesterase subunit
MEKTLEERWFPFTTYCLNDTEHKKIFCFHHAGGSASVYRKWTLEKKNMNFVCVELPGKGTRRREPFVGDFKKLLEPLCASIIKVTQGKPFILFGHSMGAAMAFYVADYLQSKYNVRPEKLIAAGRQAPQDEDPSEFKTYMGDDALIRELKKYNATPKEILENKELLQFILPEVRKD